MLQILWVHSGQFDFCQFLNCELKKLIFYLLSLLSLVLVLFIQWCLIACSMMLGYSFNDTFHTSSSRWFDSCVCSTCHLSVFYSIKMWALAFSFSSSLITSTMLHVVYTNHTLVLIILSIYYVSSPFSLPHTFL